MTRVSGLHLPANFRAEAAYLQRKALFSPPIGAKKVSWGAQRSSPTTKAMGQIVSFIQGSGSREKTLRLISDRVFERIKSESTTEYLTLADINVAILYLYNEINKNLPGPHNDPPTKEHLKFLIKQHDLNLDGKLSREEFFEFVKEITKGIASDVGKRMFLALVVAPALALLTKKSTEKVPTVGNTVKKIPDSVYASIASAAVLLVQNFGQASVQ